jgi:hypothetical protein
MATASAAIAVLGGCQFAYFSGSEGFWGGTTDPGLLSVVVPVEDDFRPGDTVEITWDGTAQPAALDIDLYASGALHTELANGLVNDGEFWWSIPIDFEMDPEVENEYQIVVSGYHLQQTDGALLLTAYSQLFSIVMPSVVGLSDVTVSASTVVATVRDNGQLVDGDTVDLYLNGSLLMLNHVLVGGGGTMFTLALQSGDNLFDAFSP